MEIFTTSLQCGDFISVATALCLSDFMHVVLTERISWEEMVNSQNPGFTFKVLSGKMSFRAETNMVPWCN